jgi:hypothetical protein
VTPHREKLDLTAKTKADRDDALKSAANAYPDLHVEIYSVSYQIFPTKLK